MAEELGYMVVAVRPSLRGYGGTDIASVGHCWSSIQPCESHQAYCQGMAEQDSERYGDVKYVIAKLTEVEQ